MQRDSDEDAWRAIVENYGDRAELDDERPPSPPRRPRRRAGHDAAGSAGLERLFRPLPEPEAPSRTSTTTSDEFVPPPPPPLPKVPPDRLLAWVGLFGSPTVLLVCLVLGVHLAPWLGYLLVASFIGGFVYLVVQMPRGPHRPLGRRRPALVATPALASALARLGPAEPALAALLAQLLAQLLALELALALAGRPDATGARPSGPCRRRR